MGLPRIVITGASGFLGRHLLAALKDRYRIHALAWHPTRRLRVPAHPNIVWYNADIADKPATAAVFGRIEREGGARTVIHLAAHYDFTGEYHPTYWMTNVAGTHNVLDLTRRIGAAHFIFASSTAACRFPRPGEAIDERSPADADNPYAVSKAIGERMIADFAGTYTPCTVRLAAVFSDWCEYPPLFMLFCAWLSRRWDARVVAGRGTSALPYLHVRDAVTFFETLLSRLGTVAAGDVYIAGRDGATSHEEICAAATDAFFGRPANVIRLPAWICRAGLHARDALGRLGGKRPFERPWMGAYIDRALRLDTRRTRERLGWTPRDTLEILRRIPVLVRNFSEEPVEWARRNQATIKLPPATRHVPPPLPEALPGIVPPMPPLPAPPPRWTRRPTKQP